MQQWISGAIEYAKGQNAIENDFAEYVANLIQKELCHRKLARGHLNDIANDLINQFISER